LNSPDVGAHVVLFRTLDGQNVLLSDPKLWTAPAPRCRRESQFLGYNGHIYWFGPRRLVVQQEVNPEKKKSSNWPPDRSDAREI